MNKPRLGVLHTTDLTALAELEADGFDPPWSNKLLTTYLTGERYRCFGLWHDEQLHGFALLSTVLDEAELLQIAVRSEYRGQGWATLLIHYVHTQLQHEAINRCLLEVSRANKAALNLYQRLGYQQDGIRKGYYPSASGSEDAILMSCDQLQRASKA
ncbi:ribosomal protein S18-alanine N-acetyltransferase [Amphritea sp. 1_MG-2023]|uniref:ribosomal protein S18-alanine N-acetyltransferase n=1 Tax=Amphritea sp. 1_MG-2023 TaxID=3062670 RepID=UPI0026E2EA92|nr:ribosomal protein S18-alanine N-acetyltransferase [Amphritea sp. 1_MG-2023]MDO6565362.1 ribosomal protein S18-alanine N-acetyltransferase [Amphritea sp. 1_MG-2023]